MFTLRNTRGSWPQFPGKHFFQKPVKTLSLSRDDDAVQQAIEENAMQVTPVLENRPFYGPECAIASLKNVPKRSNSYRMSSKCSKNAPKTHPRRNLDFSWILVPFLAIFSWIWMTFWLFLIASVASFCQLLALSVWLPRPASQGVGGRPATTIQPWATIFR